MSDTAPPCLSVTARTAAAPSSALDLCGCTRSALLATRRQHGVQVQEQLCRRALHARADGLDAADHLLCEGAVCTRACDRVLRRCHAAPMMCCISPVNGFRRRPEGCRARAAGRAPGLRGTLRNEECSVHWLPQPLNKFRGAHRAWYACPRHSSASLEIKARQVCASAQRSPQVP